MKVAKSKSFHTNEFFFHTKFNALNILRFREFCNQKSFNIKLFLPRDRAC